MSELTPEQQRRATTFHESGHAVVYAVALGHEVIFITTSDENKNGRTTWEEANVPVADQVIAGFAGDGHRNFSQIVRRHQTNARMTFARSAFFLTASGSIPPREQRRESD